MSITTFNLTPIPMFQLHFNHPVKELIMNNMTDMTDITDMQIEKYNLKQQIIREKYLEEHDVKKQMKKILSEISKLRKFYRKNSSCHILEELNKKETLYRQLYNKYWYDYKYHKYVSNYESNYKCDCDYILK